ncbi:MAG: hypothetical protein JSU68_02140 [Phycisphaerales bacterium]|nr:MAG: hypothetical protein JSU68_02140 [Phycisphaerales bacterium]
MNTSPLQPVAIRIPAFWKRTAVLALLIFAGHGASLPSGFFHDDHVHIAHLKNGGWHPGDFVQASLLGTDVLMVRYWWLQYETRWHPLRPLTLAIMKVEHTLCGYRAWPMHAFSLVWHVANAVLVMLLAWRFLGDAFWATAAGGVFALHPGHFETVQWVMAQTELTGAFFLLLATLCYANFSGWPRGGGLPETDAAGSYQWLIGACAGYAAALGCRESALVLPAALFVLDCLWGRRIGRRQWVGYACLVLVAAVYLLLASRALGGTFQQGRPHIVPPDDPEFLRFIYTKALLYFLAVFVYVPALQIPVGVWLESHLVFGTLLVIAAAAAAWVHFFPAMCERRGAWAWLLWPAVFLAPLLPVFAASHHLYTPLAGWAVLLAAALMLGGRKSDKRRRISLVVLGIAVVGFTVGCNIAGYYLREQMNAEHALISSVARHRGRIKAGDHLAFVDMPLLACTANATIERELGLEPGSTTMHCLTVRPLSAGPDQAGRLTPVEERALRVEAAGPAYFSGPEGTALLEVGGWRRMFGEGQRFEPNELFDVVVLQADRSGVQALRFDFHPSLSREGLFVFRCSYDGSAELLGFDGQNMGRRPAP